MKHNLIIGLLCAVVLASCSSKTYQGWMQYTDVEEVGYSKAALDSLSIRLKKTNMASMLVTYKGNVLFSYGDNTRRYPLRSMRKSLMSAMYGIEIAKGNIQLEETLNDLKIDDMHNLTSTEKSAKVKDLLSARSGIYIPSAYTEKSNSKLLPERGSYKPGEHWIYNNWDFNALLTIYEQQTGKKFFEAFEKEMATVLDMQDFRLIDTYYRFEKDKSEHPAYLFKMSARDLAKFGQLYLNNGTWQGNQILSKDWIQTSTAPKTDAKEMGPFGRKGSYGYLWWSTSFKGYQTFFASGAGGQRVFIIPEIDMVVVMQTNTYEGKGLGNAQIRGILSKVIDAKKQTDFDEKDDTTLSSFEPVPVHKEKKYEGTMDDYLGTYKHRFLGNMSIRKEGTTYLLQNGLGYFNLIPMTNTSFWVENIETYLELKKAKEEKQKYTIRAVMKKDRSKMEKVIFYY